MVPMRLDRAKITPYPNVSKTLGRYLGPSKSIGPEMCFHILKANGWIVQRTTVGPLSPSEFENIPTKTQVNNFMMELYRGPLGTTMTDSKLKDSGDDPNTTPAYQSYSDNICGDEPTMPEGDAFTIDAYDKCIGAQLDLLLQDAMASATVITRKQDPKGNPVGSSNANPLLDTCVYEVKFPDGSIKDFTANIIAQNMYAQVDDEGWQFNIMEELVDYRKNEEAVPTTDGYVTVNGHKHPKRTTQGWQLCVKWRDGSTSWEHLKGFKEANLIKMAGKKTVKSILRLYAAVFSLRLTSSMHLNGALRDLSYWRTFSSPVEFS
jgi:hypothetical protein